MWQRAEPAWDPRGQLPLLPSDREFAPQLSTASSGTSPATARRGDLRPGAAQGRQAPVPAARATRSDGEGRAKKDDDEDEGRDEDEDKDEKHKDKKAEKPPITIDFDGLAERVDARAGRRRQLSTASRATKGRICSTSKRGAPLLRPRQRPAGRRSCVFDSKDRKDDDARRATCSGYALSRRRHEGAGRARDAATPARRDARRARTSKKTSRPRGLWSTACPPQEWAQIFDEVWRRYRDFFYVANMHGYDWEALARPLPPLLAARRAPLRPELRDRRDDRRAERRPRLRRRRRLPAPRRGRRWRCPARASSSTRRAGRYRSRRSSAAQNEEDDVPLAADRGRRGR